MHTYIDFMPAATKCQQGGDRDVSNLVHAIKHLITATAAATCQRPAAHVRLRSGRTVGDVECGREITGQWVKIVLRVMPSLTLPGGGTQRSSPASNPSSSGLCPGCRTPSGRAGR